MVSDEEEHDRNCTYADSLDGFNLTPLNGSDEGDPRRLVYIRIGEMLSFSMYMLKSVFDRQNIGYV